MGKTDSQLYKRIENIYKNNQNYEIIDINSQKELAVIYFSSNGLYDFNDRESFLKNIELENRFEFKKNMLKKANRHIFVRDVFINWYFLGINKNINSISSTIKFLEILTKEYKKIICIGISGGGYMAMLIGSLLKANYVLSFSGQIDVISFAKNVQYNFPYCDITNKNISPYLNIKNILNSNQTLVFNFVANDCIADKENIDISLNISSIKTFLVKTDKHGLIIPKKYLSYFLNVDKQDLIKIWSKLSKNNIPIEEKELIKCIPLFYRIIDFLKKISKIFYTRKVKKDGIVCIKICKIPIPNKLINFLIKGKIK